MTTEQQACSQCAALRAELATVRAALRSNLTMLDDAEHGGNVKVTIVHIGGTEKLVEFESFDAPRPWIRLRYPGGGGLFSFALAHGGIECERSLTPEWRVSDADLATLRERATELKIKFKVVAYYPRRRALPGAPKKKTNQKNLELFPEPAK